jgi:protein TonB
MMGHCQASPSDDCRRDVGGLAVGWRYALLSAVLLVHGLALVAGYYGSIFRQDNAELSGVLQVRWIDAARPVAPAGSTPVVRPRPLPVKPQPAPVVRSRPKPVLAVAADVPSPARYERKLPVSPGKEPSRSEEAANPPSGTAAAVPAGMPPPTAPSFNADYLSNPAPEYPSMSRRLREQGRVTLRVRVTAEGKPDAVELAQGSGFERLDQAAHDVVWRWRFVPARQGGRDIAGWVIVPIRFSLRG